MKNELTPQDASNLADYIEKGLVDLGEFSKAILIPLLSSNSEDSIKVWKEFLEKGRLNYEKRKS